MNYIWLIWCILTWITAMLCTIGCLLPYWLDGKIFSNDKIIIHEQNHIKYTTIPTTYYYKDISSTLNLFRRCIYPVYTNLITDILSENSLKAKLFFNQPINYKLNIKQHNFESSLIHIQTNCGYYQFFDIPHIAWRYSLILLIISCCSLFFLAFLLSFIGCYLNFLWKLNIHRICQLGLLLTGLLILLCCILFPIGWSDNDEIIQICGERRSRFDLGHCQLGWAYVVTIMSGLLSIFSSVFPNLCFPKILFEIKQNNKSQRIKSNEKQTDDGLIPHFLSHDLSMTPTILAPATPGGPPSIETVSTSLRTSDPRIHHVGFESPWLKTWACLNTPTQHQSHGPVVLIHPDYNLSPYSGGCYNGDNQLGYSQGSLDDTSSVGTEKKSAIVNSLKPDVAKNLTQNMENNKSNN
ncbi:unnamed protein product [Schistosoma margrebowiei]|uniref:Uncharacterized protein n=1 Tax=Schistosoma margrebowiei TaxID=48269 RepID=A0AA85AKY2_9TREM|nr:unnamed protein product [Schistosoma margrebowiei]